LNSGIGPVVDALFNISNKNVFSQRGAFVVSLVGRNYSATFHRNNFARDVYGEVYLFSDLHYLQHTY
jgi:hypothetical protein